MTVYLTLDNTPYTGGGQVILNELAIEEVSTDFLICPDGQLAKEASEFTKVIVLDTSKKLVEQALEIRKQIQILANDAKAPVTLHIHGISALPLGILATVGISGLKRNYTEHLYTKQYSLPNKKKHAKQLFALKILLRFIDQIFCVSKAVQSFLIDDLKIPEIKTTIKYNPVHFIRSVCEYKRRDVLKIASVGSLTFVKNFNQLLEIITLIISTTPVELTIIGDGVERENLKAQAKALGIEHNVKFLLTLSHAEVIEELTKQDIYVQTSLSESFGYALTEAMGIGLPCVAFSVGGIPEVIEDDLSGLLIQPYNSELFVVAIKKLAADVELRRILGLSGKRALSKFR
jgi:glycosyltransferase involved in cell wall biosynthesis